MTCGSFASRFADPVPQPRGHMDMTFSIHNDGLDVWQGLDKLHSQFNSHHKDPCVQPIGPDSFTSNHCDTLATTRRLKCARIENMMISDPIPHEETFIIPGGRYGFVL